MPLQEGSVHSNEKEVFKNVDVEMTFDSPEAVISILKEGKLIALYRVHAVEDMNSGAFYVDKEYEPDAAEDHFDTTFESDPYPDDFDDLDDVTPEPTEDSEELLS